MLTSRTTLRAAMVAALLAIADAASAVPCGTVATPLPCSIAVGDLIHVARDFFLLGFPYPAGGGTAYQGEDVSIDLSSAGGFRAIVTFTKNPAGPNPGSVFVANPGQTSVVNIAYSFLAETASGSFAYPTSLTTSFVASETNNGLTTLYTIVAGAPGCIAFTGSPIAHCAVPPFEENPGLPTGDEGSLLVFDGLTLTANEGSIAVESFQNRFDVSFLSAVVAVPSLGWKGLLALIALLAAAGWLVLRGWPGSSML